MEVDRQQAYIAAYAREAHGALQRFVAGERDDAFLLRALELIRTYLHVPRLATSPQPTDLPIIRLAQALQCHLFDRGFWRQLILLWPQLIDVAAHLGEPLIHAELVKQLAIIKANQGDSRATDLLYTSLLHSPQFPQLPAALQADVLHQVGTTLAWQGKLAQAHILLDQVLTLVEQHPIDPDHRNQTDRYGVRSGLDVTPMWESKAYALNQLGNVAMFQGKFRLAECRYTACWTILNEYGEAENLACVAHQALGWLWLHWHQPKRAIPVLEKGIAIRRRRQERENVAINLVYLAAALLQQQQLDRAEPLLTEALPILRASGNRRDTGLCHLYFGQLALLRGQRIAAIEQWQQALAHLQTVHTPLVEQRIFMQYSLWLLAVGEITMLRKVSHQLYTSLRQQGLQPMDWGRLLVRLR